MHTRYIFLSFFSLRNSSCELHVEFLFSAANAGDFIPVVGEQCTIEPSASSQPVCVNISTVEDNVLESMEVFTVSLSTSDPGVLVNSTAVDAPVTIIDDDCE